MAKVYWQERKSGQRLILYTDDGAEVEVGAVRRTPRGYDALAKTNTYDPGRAQKGLASMEQAKAFVEEFHPWDIFGGDLDMDVEPEVRPNPDGTSAEATSETEQPNASVGTSTSTEIPQTPGDEPFRPAGEDEQPSKRRGLQFWKKG